MVKRNQMRVGQKFFDFRTNFKQEIAKTYGHVSDEELTDELAGFLQREKLDAYMLNRIRRRGRGGLNL